ncbi:hypothetical protein C0J52_10567 [Blattella germanica]|nr:hypothetical protein C0J52_10567 [Blattella germanica]
MLPYMRRHSQRNAARDYQIEQWTMQQLMVLAIFLIVDSEWCITLEITSKDVDVFKMC